MKKRLSAVFAALLSVIWMSAAWADSASTPINDDSAARRDNIALAVEALNGVVIEDGDSFSFNEAVGARTRDNGYKAALNGRGVKVVGGGVAQVASTLYLAALEGDGLEVSELHTYGSRYTGDYVDSGDQAVLVDYNSDLDFKIKNNTGKDVVVYVGLDEDEMRMNVEFWIG